MRTLCCSGYLQLSHRGSTVYVTQVEVSTFFMYLFLSFVPFYWLLEIRLPQEPHEATKSSNKNKGKQAKGKNYD